MEGRESGTESDARPQITVASLGGAFYNCKGSWFSAQQWEYCTGFLCAKNSCWDLGAETMPSACVLIQWCFILWPLVWVLWRGHRQAVSICCPGTKACVPGSVSLCQSVMLCLHHVLSRIASAAAAVWECFVVVVTARPCHGRVSGCWLMSSDSRAFRGSEGSRRSQKRVGSAG